MKTILPYKYSTYNCIENCIANVCDAVDIVHLPIFINSWDFNYRTSKLTIGERLYDSHSDNERLKDYFYTSSLYLNIDFISEPLIYEKLYKKCINGKIYLIEIDSYDCDWSPAYKKYHYPHYFILNGDLNGEKDTDKNNLFIIDSYTTPNLINFDSNILNRAKNCFKIDIPYYKNILTKTDLKDDFFNFVESNLRQGVYDKIESFANDILLCKSLEELTPHILDISNSYIIRRLSYIVNSRKNVLLLMKYLEQSSQILFEFQLLIEKWENLKNYFIKIIISNKIHSLSKASDIIYSIALLEKKIAKNLT